MGRRNGSHKVTPKSQEAAQRVYEQSKLISSSDVQPHEGSSALQQIISSVAILEKSNENKKSELQRLEKEKDNLIQVIDVQKDQIILFKEKVEVMEKQKVRIEVLEKSLSQKTEMEKKLLLKLDNLEQNAIDKLKQKESNYILHEAEMNNLRKTHGKLQTEVVKLQEELKERTQLQKEQLQKGCQIMETLKSKIAALISEKTAIESKFSSSKEENEKLLRQNKEIKENFDKLSARNKSLVCSVEKMKNLEAENSTLSMKLTELEKMNENSVKEKESSLQKHKKEVLSLEARLDTKTEECIKRGQDLSFFEKKYSAEIKTLKTKIQTLLAEVREGENSLKIVKENFQKSQDKHLKDLNARDKEIKDLRVEKKFSRISETKYSERIEFLQSEVAKSKEEIKEVTTLLTRKSKEATEILKERKKQLQKVHFEEKACLERRYNETIQGFQGKIAEEKLKYENTVGIFKKHQQHKQTELENLKQNEIRLKQKLENENKQKKCLEEQNKSLKRYKVSNIEEIKKLKKELRISEEDKKSVQAEYTHIKHVSSLQLEEQRKDIEIIKETYQQKINVVELKYEKLDENFRKTSTDLKDMMETLEKEKQEFRSLENKVLKQENNFNEEKKMLVLQVNALGEKLQEKNQEISNTEKKKSNCVNENGTLEKQVQQLQVKCAEQIIAFRNDVNNTREKLEASENALENKNKEISRNRKNLVEYEKSLNDVEFKYKVICEKHAKEIAGLSKELDEATEKNERLEKRINSLEKKNEASKKNALRLEKLNSKLSLKEKECAGLVERNTLEKQSFEKQVNKIAKRNAELIKECERRKATEVKLLTQVKKATSETEISRQMGARLKKDILISEETFSREKEELKEEQKTLKKAILKSEEALRNTQKKSAGVISNLEATLREEKSSFIQEKERFELTLARLKAELKDCNNLKDYEVSEEKRKLSKIKKLHENVSLQKTKCEDNVKVLQDKIKGIMLHLRERETSLVDLQEKQNSCKNRINKLIESETFLEERNNTLLNQLDNFKLQLENTKQKYEKEKQSAQSKISEVENHLEENKIKLNSVVNTSDIKLSGLKRQVNSLRSAKSILENEVRVLRQGSEDLNRENENLLNQFAEKLKHTETSYQTQLSSLNQQLDDVRNSYEGEKNLVAKFQGQHTENEAKLKEKSSALNALEVKYLGLEKVHKRIYENYNELLRKRGAITAGAAFSTKEVKIDRSLMMKGSSEDYSGEMLPRLNTR
eukprot:augustus_masked-scaffold_11-processed-gene-2.41-mRNA-1 protein AED:1.00 eAED:1.00 QI:0/-1/0/0/-1/1/1/0/1237